MDVLLKIEHGPGLFPVLGAVVVVCLLLALFILPDYICWRRRLAQLPTVQAHQIQFVDEKTCRQALELIMKEPHSTRFERFCQVSRAMTKSKEKRAGSDGQLLGGAFRIGDMPEEYEALERVLFSHQSKVDSVLGPVQTHRDAWHLAYLLERHDPAAERRRERLAKLKQEQGDKGSVGAAAAVAGGGGGDDAAQAAKKKKKKKKERPKKE